MSIQTIGLTEKIAALTEFAEQIPDAAEQGMREGMQPIRQAMYTYPDQPGYMGKREPAPALYERTNNYRDGISQVQLYQEAGGVVGEIDSGAPYSIYLRGTPDGSYGGAWMHLGIWQPLFDIVEQFLPGISERIQANIDQLAARLGLS